MQAALLIAEPEAETRGFLERQLAGDGFHVVGAEAPEPARAGLPDLVLLGEPEALDVVRSWSPEVPVIVLGRPGSEPGDRLRAFEHGCDDYIASPFQYEELLARIRAVLRRAGPAPPDVVGAGEIAVDRTTRRVTVSGRRVDLAAKEYDLLVRLAREPDRVFTKDELLREVWGFRAPGRTRTLDSHASRLRRKLAAAGGTGYIVNVWGVRRGGTGKRRQPWTDLGLSRDCPIKVPLRRPTAGGYPKRRRGVGQARSGAPSESARCGERGGGRRACAL
jgi:DNA-binding response OmpR family regulator